MRLLDAWLRAQASKVHQLGIRGTISRSAPADANETRNGRIYYDFAQAVIVIARRLYADEPLAVYLADTVYALDAITIDLCLALFPWAPFRKAKVGTKLHTLLDLRGAIPSLIHSDAGGERAAAIYSLIGTAKLNDVDPERIYVSFSNASPSNRSTASRNCCRGMLTRNYTAIAISNLLPESPIQRQ